MIVVFEGTSSNFKESLNEIFNHARAEHVDDTEAVMGTELMQIT